MPDLPTTIPGEDRPRGAARGAILLLALIAGAAIGVFLLPRLFRVVPNDLSRVETVLKVVGSGPAIVVFGDSRAEAAVDAAQLSRALPGAPLAYNLAWHAQHLDHAALLYERLAPDTRTVIQFVALTDLATQEPSDLRIGVAMRLYGWTPQPSDLEMMHRSFGDQTPAYLTSSRLRLALQARWGLRQLADISLRQLIRRDLMPERERYDLFFPSPYKTRLDEKHFGEIFATGKGPVDPRPLSRSRAHLLSYIGQGARRVIVVLPPAHSGLLLSDHDRRSSELRDFANRAGIQFIDGSRWIADRDFADPLHVNLAGARAFTARLAAAIESQR